VNKVQHGNTMLTMTGLELKANNEIVTLGALKLVQAYLEEKTPAEFSTWLAGRIKELAPR
jgi:hypothetical protein